MHLAKTSYTQEGWRGVQQYQLNTSANELTSHRTPRANKPITPHLSCLIKCLCDRKATRRDSFFSAQHLIIMSGRKRILRSKQSSLLLKTTLLILSAETQTLIFAHWCHIFLLLKKAGTAYLQLVNKLLK